jgi:hypothetical protein
VRGGMRFRPAFVLRMKCRPVRQAEELIHLTRRAATRGPLPSDIPADCRYYSRLRQKSARRGNFY